MLGLRISQKNEQSANQADSFYRRDPFLSWCCRDCYFSLSLSLAQTHMHTQPIHTLSLSLTHSLSRTHSLSHTPPASVLEPFKEHFVGSPLRRSTSAPTIKVPSTSWLRLNTFRRFRNVGTWSEFRFSAKNETAWQPTPVWSRPAPEFQQTWSIKTVSANIFETFATLKNLDQFLWLVTRPSRW